MTTIELIPGSGRFVDLSPTHRKHARRYSWLVERLTRRKAAKYHYWAKHRGLDRVTA